jgi:NADPH-dependent 2,4-dienoyl-CoA reductase/sulfur reductase-like enzyme
VSALIGRQNAGSVLIVGASLAGLRAAETLRSEGFDGGVVVVGAEDHLPYDRPPLSKEVLAGVWAPAETELLRPDEPLDVEWRLGQTAVSLDLDRREVVLDDGERLRFGGLVIATGARPRTLPGTPPLAGIYTLRTLDDCLALRDELDRGPGRVVVVGAGFIGSEVAATVRGRGIDVTLVEALPVPLAGALGERIGGVMAEVHLDHGVDVRLGIGVEGFDGGGPDGRVERVRLSDGTTVVADVVVVGVGVRPNTEWLDGSGIEVADGVVCDETCLAGPGVVATGDVARWPNRRFGEVMRVEHWENAQAQGEHAARRLLAEVLGPTSPGATTEAYAPVPWFWSDQYDRKIQLAGRAGPGDDVEIVEGSLAERQFVALYGRNGRLVGTLGMNRARPVMLYRRQIMDGVSWEAALNP